MLSHLASRFKAHHKKIDEWLFEMERRVKGEPAYASVDLRNAGYKIAPVDTNIYPAGWNNLCPSYLRKAGELFKAYFEKYQPGVLRMIILAEEHTRNLFYLENLFILRNILKEQGLEVEIASLSPELTANENKLQTSEGNPLTIWRAKITGYLLNIEPYTPDLILVNNDFSSGIPSLIKKIVQPMVPTPLLGWHTRKKSDHFAAYQKISHDFGEVVGIDPWLIFAPFLNMGDIDFSDPKSMTRLATKVDVLLSEIKPKFREYKLTDTPYVFVKNDAGTYGMAVTTVESGDELLHLNKKERTKMKMGKGKRLVTEVIIQEGIPTVDRFKGAAAEPVIYLIGNKMCGGFFRLHESGDTKGNLNQPGMKFTKLCFHEMVGYLNEYEKKFDVEDLSSVYNMVARLASLAAGCEIKHATT